MSSIPDNGQALRQLLVEYGLTQPAALALLNEGQLKPMALRTFKTYLAGRDSKTRVACPDAVLKRMKEIVGVS